MFLHVGAALAETPLSGSIPPWLVLSILLSGTAHALPISLLLSGCPQLIAFRAGGTMRPGKSHIDAERQGAPES